MDWSDVLRGALSFFLVVAGVGIVYVCIRLGGLLARLTKSLGEMTTEVVPILTRAQGTVDGINLELARVDEIMVTAVHATKGAERTVSTLSGAATAPVKKASGLAAAAREAYATFRARRAAGPDEAQMRAEQQTAMDIPYAQAQNERDAAREAFVNQGADLRAASDAQGAPAAVVTPPASAAPTAANTPPPPPATATGAPERGPSDAMKEWALPKKRGSE